MRKITNYTISLCLIFILFFSFSARTQAANSNSSAGKVAVTSGNLNVRTSASTSSAIIKSIKKDSWITLMGKSGSFWKVEYAPGKYGYCSANYIKERTASYVRYVATSSTNLNVRSGAGTSFKKIASLPPNKAVVVLTTTGNYSRILFDGVKIGYVPTKYLSKSKSAVTYSKISITVPSYKQNDSRWSGVKIGTQGGTIGTIGCTTTCLAMSESKRKGSTVTPKAMASSLTYSSGGMLYWPSNYLTENAASNYLSRIYSILKSGKPVIFGSKKANGSQHWVVVTGYTKSGSTLSAAGFTINDPGSNSRTTLNEFLASYPNVYKIACYS